VKNDEKKTRKVHVIPEVEVIAVHKRKPANLRVAAIPEDFDPTNNATHWRCYAELSEKTVIGCDLVIMATGVTPCSDIWHRDSPQLKLAEDKGISVDAKMRTSVPDVFACGDVCTAEGFDSTHWSQVRLWTQAKSMGAYAARIMLFGDEIEVDICFDIFTHVTSFFGYDVILIGDFAGVNMKPPYDAHVRCTIGHEYIKVLVQNGRVHGAVLIGNTELAETLQNLILNKTDVSDIEEDMLNPQFDLEDYYD